MGGVGMIGFWIMLLVAVILGGILVMTRNRQHLWALHASGWFGSMLLLSAFFFLPFIKLGPPETFQDNVTWIIQQTQFIDEIKSVPEINNIIASVQRPKEEDMVNFFEQPAEKMLIGYSAESTLVNAWRFALLARSVHPVLTLALWGLLLLAIILALLNLFRLVSGQAQPVLLAAILTGIFLLCSLYLIIQVPFIDSLGGPLNLRIRLLAAFVQVETGSGPWVILLGALLVGFSTLADWIPGMLTAKKAYDPDQEIVI
jgi:hypothetical protein